MDLHCLLDTQTGHSARFFPFVGFLCGGLHITAMTHKCNLLLFPKQAQHLGTGGKCVPSHLLPYALQNHLQVMKLGLPPYTTVLKHAHSSNRKGIAVIF